VIGPCTDPRHIKVRVELGFVSSSTPLTMSPASTKQTVEELRARHQAEEDRLFEEEIWRLAEEEERWKQKEEDEWRWEEDERKRRLEVTEKEYARQKELEKVRWEKRKVVELEDSGEETEKELEGSNKKVGPNTYMNSVELIKGIDKVKTGWWSDITTL
jgi:predicted DNA-binding protein (MmcQ/YjbR family)